MPSSSSSSAIWIKLASNMDGPSRWVSMVRNFPTFLLRTANLGLRLGVVVLERLRVCPVHLCLGVFARHPTPTQGSPPGSCTLERRRWMRVEDGSPTLDLRRALLVGTATLGLRWRQDLASASTCRAASFLLKWRRKKLSIVDERVGRLLKWSSLAVGRKHWLAELLNWKLLLRLLLHQENKSFLLMLHPIKHL